MTSKVARSSSLLVIKVNLSTRPTAHLGPCFTLPIEKCVSGISEWFIQDFLLSTHTQTLEIETIASIDPFTC